MPLDIEFSRPLRSTSQLRSLVLAIVDAHASDEQHFIEWKGSLELGKLGREGHFSIAKCILAMANRPVESAHNYFGGCGYMIIGAEPGQLHDVHIPDMADLEPWVQRYTGPDGPTWSGHTVRLESTTALVIIIEPPSDGDPMYPLMREWAPSEGSKKGHQAGVVFVRHQGRSEPMTPADLAALQQRLLAGHSGPPRIDGLQVEAGKGDAVQVIDIDGDQIDAAVLRERESLTLPAEQPADGTRAFSVYRPLSTQAISEFAAE